MSIKSESVAIYISAGRFPPTTHDARALAAHAAIKRGAAKFVQTCQDQEREREREPWREFGGDRLTKSHIEPGMISSLQISHLASPASASIQPS